MLVEGQKVKSNVYLDVNLRQVTDKRSPIVIDNLNIESIYPDDPDYQLIQEAKRDSKKSYSLEEAFRLIDEDWDFR